MAHPLDGAFAKVARGNEHFQTLKTAIEDPSADHLKSISMGQEFDSDTSTVKLFFQGVPELPIRWGLITADALQNLRAALNYLAWELAKWNLLQRGIQREPVDPTQFPINTKPRRFSRRFVADLHPAHAARIEALQPNGPEHLSTFSEDDLIAVGVEDLAATHPLAVLAQLTNADKHRALQVAVAGFAGGKIGPETATDCTIVQANFTLFNEVQDGTPFMTFDVIPTGPNPEVQVEHEIQFGVLIGNHSFGTAYPRAWETVLSLVREFKPVF